MIYDDALSFDIAQDQQGNTPLHEAAPLGATDVLHWLIMARADPKVRNAESLTAAQVAARAGAREAAVMLRLHVAAFAGQPSFEDWHAQGSPSSRGAYPEPAQPEAEWSAADPETAWRSRQGQRQKMRTTYRKRLGFFSAAEDAHYVPASSWWCCCLVWNLDVILEPSLARSVLCSMLFTCEMVVEWTVLVIAMVV